MKQRTAEAVMREGLTGLRYRVSAPLERTGTLMRQAPWHSAGVCMSVCMCMWACVCVCVYLCMCVHMCESVRHREREAVTRGETVLQSSREMVRKISPWGWYGGPTHYLWKQMSPVGQSSDMPQLILRVCFLYFLSIFPFSCSFKMSILSENCFIRSLAAVKARDNHRERFIYTPLSAF